MTPERTAKFKRVARSRQPDLCVILENVHDHHNIGAVLRSCDSVGIQQIFILNTEAGLEDKNIEIGRRTSMGAQKWVDVHFYADVEACFQHVKQSCDLVFGTHLSEESKVLYELDLSQSVAILFGNERDGISDKVLPYLDGNFMIPQVGMVESLNISVACAVTLYEAYRQRAAKGYYEEHPSTTPSQQNTLFQEFVDRHKSGDSRLIVARKSGDV
ncbi:MAG: RNA methyltransferase [Bacteroidota bacterium]